MASIVQWWVPPHPHQPCLGSPASNRGRTSSSQQQSSSSDFKAIGLKLQSLIAASLTVCAGCSVVGRASGGAITKTAAQREADWCTAYNRATVHGTLQTAYVECQEPQERACCHAYSSREACCHADVHSYSSAPSFTCVCLLDQPSYVLFVCRRVC